MATLPNKRTVASILAAVRSWLPTIDAQPDYTIVPTETWLRVHERLRAAESRPLPRHTPAPRRRLMRQRGDA